MQSAPARERGRPMSTGPLSRWTGVRRKTLSRVGRALSWRRGREVIFWLLLLGNCDDRGHRRHDAGELLSPTQVNTFLSCPAKWYFRCIRTCGAADRNAGAGHGVSCRSGSQFRRKIETKQEVPAQELEE